MHMKWCSNLDSLSGSNNDTYYKYKEYYESIISVPYNVHHELTIPSETYQKQLRKIVQEWSEIPACHTILSQLNS